MDAPLLQVVCLCADWCGVCREWRAAFDAAAGAHPQARFAWVDVEDEAAVMGDVDVETFPTLLVAAGNEVRFFGPVQPSAEQMSRLLSSLSAQAAGAAASAEARALWVRLAPLLDASRSQQM